MPTSRYLIGSLPYYSVLIVTGMVLAIALACAEERRRALPRDTVIDLALYLIPSSILGARAYYVLFSWKDYVSRPLSVFAVWEGGLAIYGGILAGLAAVFVFSHRRRLPFLLLADLIVPGLAFAQSLGRWGNFFNMEAYGWPVTNPSLQFFPMAVLIPEGGVPVWHLATFFYESLWDFFLFFFLWFTRKQPVRQGTLFFRYTGLYAAGRLVIEGFRMDSLMAGSFRVSQLLAYAACLASVLVFLVRSAAAWRKAAAPLPCLLCALECAAFFLLPRPETEAAFAPWFFLALSLVCTLAAFLVPASGLLRACLALIPALAWAGFAASLHSSWLVGMVFALEASSALIVLSWPQAANMSRKE